MKEYGMACSYLTDGPEDVAVLREAAEKEARKSAEHHLTELGLPLEYEIKTMPPFEMVDYVYPEGFEPDPFEPARGATEVLRSGEWLHAVAWYVAVDE